LARTRRTHLSLFRDRPDAGRRLAAHLTAHRGGDAIVLGLARGGIPVAAEVARRLLLPLEVVVVRKVGLPRQPELAIGAVADYGASVVNEEVVVRAGLGADELQRLFDHATAEVERLGSEYRGGRTIIDPSGRTAILVDDGLATGASMRAALVAVATAGASSTVVAVPVAPLQTGAELRGEADEVVCLETPEPFLAVSLSYDDFRQTTDDEVRELVASSSSSHRLPSSPPE
jgi:putative phosphoribosyl transferase